uniref:Merozoite surface protein 1 n=1 Tax=Anisakis simplex TaxID=6269 RepID=A0A0M3JP94_ANISI
LGHPVYEVSKRHNNNNNNTNNNDRKTLSVDVKEEIKEEPLVAISAQQPHQQLKQQSQPQTNTAMNSMVQQDQTNLLISTNDISPKSQ